MELWASVFKMTGPPAEPAPPEPGPAEGPPEGPQQHVVPAQVRSAAETAGKNQAGSARFCCRV